nr:MAG TPA: hypothetical protein [Caudoviricetes sp.]
MKPCYKISTLFRLSQGLSVKPPCKYTSFFY